MKRAPGKGASKFQFMNLSIFRGWSTSFLQKEHITGKNPPTPPAFESISHSTIAFRFFNIDSDMLLLDQDFFCPTAFCGYIDDIAACEPGGRKAESGEQTRMDIISTGDPTWTGPPAAPWFRRLRGIHVYPQGAELLGRPSTGRFDLPAAGVWRTGLPSSGRSGD